MKALIEVDLAGCEGIHRQQALDVLAAVVDGSTMSEALSTGLFNSSLFELSRLAKPQYEGGNCPDCGEPIPDDATFGDGCENCEHVFVWGHDEGDEPEAPGVNSLRVVGLDEGMRVAVPHLTVYVDPERVGTPFMVDEDGPDDEHGRRCPGSSGNRYASAEAAGQYVARWLSDPHDDRGLHPLGTRSGTHVSVVDGGTEVRPCIVDVDNNTVTFLDPSDTHGLKAARPDSEYLLIHNDPFYSNCHQHPVAHVSRKPEDWPTAETEDTYYYE